MLQFWLIAHIVRIFGKWKTSNQLSVMHTPLHNQQTRSYANSDCLIKWWIAQNFYPRLDMRFVLSETYFNVLCVLAWNDKGNEKRKLKILHAADVLIGFSSSHRHLSEFSKECGLISPWNDLTIFAISQLKHWFSHGDYIIGKSKHSLSSTKAQTIARRAWDKHRGCKNAPNDS